MAEARQTLDPVVLIQLVPQPDRVVVEQQHFSNSLTAQPVVQQYERVGAASQAMLRRTVAGQFNQAALRFVVQEPWAIMGEAESPQSRLTRFAGFPQSGYDRSFRRPLD